MESNIKWGICPTFFMPSDSEKDAIAKQMQRRKFDVSILIGAASRCLKGLPRVLVCSSLHKGSPFPTNFWLCCPHLVKLAGEIESCGGVSQLEDFLRENVPDWVGYNHKHAHMRIEIAEKFNKSELDVMRAENPRLYASLCDNSIGIGGIKTENQVYIKCLHLQIASWLALGYHPGEKWLADKFDINQECGFVPNCG